MMEQVNLLANLWTSLSADGGIPYPWWTDELGWKTFGESKWTGKQGKEILIVASQVLEES